MILKIGWTENSSEYEAKINTEKLTVEGTIVRGKLVYNTMADAVVTMLGTWDSLNIAKLTEWFYNSDSSATLNSPWGIIFICKLAYMTAVENQIPKTDSTKILYNRLSNANNFYTDAWYIDPGDIVFTTTDEKNPTNAGIVLNCGNLLRFAKSNGINKVEVFEWDFNDPRIFGYSKINYDERSVS